MSCSSVYYRIHIALINKEKDKKEDAETVQNIQRAITQKFGIIEVMEEMSSLCLIRFRVAEDTVLEETTKEKDGILHLCLQTGSNPLPF